MQALRNSTSARRATVTGLIVVFLFLLVAIPVGAQVKELQNAFNPRGYFVTLKSGGGSQWLRSTFYTGFYRSGSGGQGGGTGDGGASRKDELGHSNVTYTGVEKGLDFVDAADVDTIYATFDHNPTPGKDYMIGYSKDEQAAQLQAIPNFTNYIGTPIRPGPTDPAGGAWWSIPVHLTLGKTNEDGSADAMAAGTLYEFAFLRGCQANNGTTCVLMPGDAPGTVKGYVLAPFTDEERAVYDAHKYDEYEFITAILPEGSSRDKTVDHTIESVPMRYRIQTYADLSKWYDSAEYRYAVSFLASVTEQDYATGKYIRQNVEYLKTAKESLDKEAEEEVKYQLQIDAERAIGEMVEELKAAQQTAESNVAVTDFSRYNKTLEDAQIAYDYVKDKRGTAVDQYRPEAVDALDQAIRHAQTTIGRDSSQTEVDTETAALETARVNALDALVRPSDEVIFTDEATGITVTAKRSSLTDNSRLVVREVVSGTTEYNEMVARVTPTPDRMAIYRILFYDGVDVVHPTQPVTVQIPLLDSLEQTAPNVYYLDNTGSPARQVTATAAQGYRIFETSDLGTFLVGGVLQNQQDPQNNQTPQQLTPQAVTPQDQNPPQNQNQTLQQNQNNNPVHTTTRTTTRAPARTTRVIRTTRNANDQNKQNEMTSTSVLQTQAVQPTTMTTTAPAPTSAQDTSDLEQEPNQHTLLYIALAVAAVGIGAAAYEFYKDKKNGGLGTDHDDEL